MAHDRDVRVRNVSLYFLPIKTRIPLKFGPEITTHTTCARALVRVEDHHGRVSEGWGETPLSVAWVWPSSLGYEPRLEAMKEFTTIIAEAWADSSDWGHPMETGHVFVHEHLPVLHKAFNDRRVAAGEPSMPWLSALVCCSLFDIATHDAYGMLHGLPSFATYNSDFMNHDLSWFYSAEYSSLFRGRYPQDYFAAPVPKSLPAWHLVGGKDLLDSSEANGAEPDDGYPVFLPDWIERDGLNCLKVKLTGTDAAWDYERMRRVGKIAAEKGVLWLSADFNCTVLDPAYVNEALDRLLVDEPRIYGMILYVEQPFPYDLENNRIDVHSVSARKPLFMDESAHDWKYLAMGRALGWTGVALKTCKTLTGALLSLCWAKTAGMTLMVQDLTNPMLAQIPHLLLAAHAGTIMGVETNSMQFYPDASIPEERVHPGVYRRRNGRVSLETLSGPGMGYRVNEIVRDLGAASFTSDQP
ncbi:MAG: enolase C-terminal domain-like protein [Clostridia bacterium]|jgi:L-alanine-DL-glutamate epimerase-like enolase superfamily enzyme